ncbi:MAG: aldo/keto reductase [Promethearchaeota archaeon]
MVFLSKITLGTAQLGFKYGINNKVGKPSKDEALLILENAYNNGITSFDTASSYGDSEKILGYFLSKKKNGKYFISTKIKSLNKINVGNQNFKEKIFTEIKKSLINLNVKTIQNYLIHDYNDIVKYENLIDILLHAKKRKLINKLGVSVYSPDQADKVINLKSFDSIQIPINIFDQRFLESNILKRLKDNKLLIFARSIFLQGLLFMPINQLPKKLYKLRPYLIKLNEFCYKNKLNISSLAINFVKKIRELDSILIGVESVDQLQQNLNDFHRKNEFEIDYSLFKINDKNLIDPRKW